MADGRRNNGGHPNSGRKSKSEEQELIEKMTPYENEVLEILMKNVRAEKSWAIKMFFQYRWGRPKEVKDISLHSRENFEIPLKFFVGNPDE